MVNLGIGIAVGFILGMMVVVCRTYPTIEDLEEKIRRLRIELIYATKRNK
tara:strand:- start:19055 stop:19204 length:150 start_codon:yes stop_codon:yes gene_type:complete